MPEIRTPTEAETVKSILAGKHGEVIIDYRFWRSNIRGEKKSLITTVESATVNLSNYRDYTWELELNLLKDENFNDESNFQFQGYVKVEGRIRTSADEFIDFPLGLYRMSDPRGSDNPFFTSWELTGKSPEIVLLDNMAATGYKVASGTGVLEAVRTILTMDPNNIPVGRINFPPDTEDVDLATDMIFSPFQDAESCYWLRICNALLAAGGFYALYTDAEGYFTTKDIEDGRRDTSITYLGNANKYDEGEELITDEIQWEYADDFFNKVVVYSSSTETAGVPVYASAELHNIAVAAPDSNTVIVVDDESEYSIEELGGHIFTRPPETYQNIKSTAEAKKLAKALLRRTATRHVTYTISTMPDFRREPREDYWIKARRSDGDILYDTQFRVVGWTLPLDAQSAMTHELNRTIKG